MLFNRNKYKITILGRAGILYKENGKSITIDSEMLSGSEYDMVIYFDSIKSWGKPIDAGSVSEEEKESIKMNILKKFKNLRISFK